MLDQIITSKTRRKILSLFFQNLSNTYHLRRVGREVGEEINAVKRELDILEKAQVLNKERRVNRSIYSLNTKYIFYDEFVRIFAKQTNFATKIYKNQTLLGKIRFFVMSMKFVSGEKISEGEIYLLFVGVVVVAELSKIVAEEEKKLGYEINYTVMSDEEFAYRKKNNDPFIWSFLKQPKVVVIGREDMLMK